MAKEELNGYDLSRQWFDWCFENPELINPNHTAMYFFIIEHCNRLGWKNKFGLPMEMTKDAIGIKNYRTYTKTFTDLVDWGFIDVHEKSKNQYSANVIAIVKNTKANTKALSKAMQKHSQKQVHGIVGIDKPINLEPNNQLTSEQENTPLFKSEFFEDEKEKPEPPKSVLTITENDEEEKHDFIPDPSKMGLLGQLKAIHKTHYPAYVYGKFDDTDLKDLILKIKECIRAKQQAEDPAIFGMSGRNGFNISDKMVTDFFEFMVVHVKSDKWLSTKGGQWKEFTNHFNEIITKAQTRAKEPPKQMGLYERLAQMGQNIENDLKQQYGTN